MVEKGEIDCAGTKLVLSGQCVQSLSVVAQRTDDDDDALADPRVIPYPPGDGGIRRIELDRIQN